MTAFQNPFLSLGQTKMICVGRKMRQLGAAIGDRGNPLNFFQRLSTAKSLGNPSGFGASCPGSLWGSTYTLLLPQRWPSTKSIFSAFPYENSTGSLSELPRVSSNRDIRFRFGTAWDACAAAGYDGAAG